MTAEQIVKDDLARAVKTAKEQEPSPSTSDKSEIKLNALVLLVTRADFDDIRDAHLPCYDLVCLFPLMMHHLWIFRLRLLTFCRSTLMSFSKTCHRLFHRFVALSTRSTSFSAPSFQTAPHTVQT
jgi:hypothetical protein